MKKVSKKDILSIKAGSSMTFPMDDAESVNSTKVYAYQLSKSKDKPDDVERYKTSVKDKLILTIIAVRK